MPGITGSMDMSLSRLQEMVKYREAWHSALHRVAKRGTQLSNWTTGTITKSTRTKLLSITDEQCIINSITHTTETPKEWKGGRYFSLFFFFNSKCFEVTHFYYFTCPECWQCARHYPGSEITHTLWKTSKINVIIPVCRLDRIAGDADPFCPLLGLIFLVKGSGDFPERHVGEQNHLCLSTE